MSVIGFTGARETTPAQAAYVRGAVAILGADAYVSGACTGVDEVIAYAVAKLQTGARNIIVVPADRSRITPGFIEAMTALPDVEIEYMPAGSSYADRNRRIVDLSDRLVGLPSLAEDHPASRRSGTWQTIRMARRAGKPVSVRILTEVAW